MAYFEKRGTSTRAVIRVDDKKLTATFDTLTEAKNWVKIMERKRASGDLAAETNKITVGEAFESYLDDVASKTDSAKWNRLRIMNWQKDPLSNIRLSKVITNDINDWIRRRGQSVSGSTVNRELNLMSGAFTYAVKDRKWVEVNPCTGARRPVDNPPRDKPFLTVDEVQSVCLATGYSPESELMTLSSRVGACFLLALETGMRSGEMLRLKPADYRPENRFVQVTAQEKGGRKGAKSGLNTRSSARRVPLTERACELIDQLLKSKPADQPYIVGLNDSQRDSLWRKAKVLAGLGDRTFHDTKHEAATRLAPYLDVLALSHAIGTKNLKLLRDTYYNNDASRSAALLPRSLSAQKDPA